MILKPDYNVESLFEVDFEKLKEEGITVILFDLDSTVMKSKSGVYSDETIELLAQLKQNFEIAVISNNKNMEYIEKVQEISDFPIVGCANKPCPKIMRQHLVKIGRTKDETVVIGDRPLTDILAGKRLGCKTVLVDSISRHTEGIPTRFVRRLERLFIRNI